MSDEIKINDLKEEERMKIDTDIPVDETAGKATDGVNEIAEEFKRLGRQFGKTLETLFTGEEMKRIETEIREGVKGFSTEVEKAMHNATESPAATRMKHEAEDIRKRVESGDVVRSAQHTFAQGLRWLSTELERAADSVNKADIGGTRAKPKVDDEEIIIEKDPNA